MATSCPKIPTVTEELVLCSVPNNDYGSTPSVLVFRVPRCPPAIPPVALNDIQRWQETGPYERGCQPTVRAVVHLNDPYGGRG